MEVSVEELFDGLETGLTGLEETLNTVGYIPGVSFASGMFRAAMGQTMVEAAILLTLGYVCAAALTCSSERFEAASRSFSMIGHGFANIGRGMLEAPPFLSLLVFYPYDQFARLQYRVEAQLNS